VTPDSKDQAPGDQVPKRLVGQPFNPYKPYPGSLIPEPICRYRGLSPGAKVIYERLYSGYSPKNGRQPDRVQTPLVGHCHVARNSF
jgi:hypothetical protein